jgi:DNA-binding response OmpR family regulator
MKKQWPLLTSMKKILYVEDNQDTAEAVQMLLCGAGYAVDLASCGKEALELSKNIYDIILLDVMLPDMSGWDIFQQLNKKLTNTKYAFLSAVPVSYERMEELKKMGVSAYITKPFTKKDLLSNISCILREADTAEDK